MLMSDLGCSSKTSPHSPSVAKHHVARESEIERLPRLRFGVASCWSYGAALDFLEGLRV